MVVIKMNKGENNSPVRKEVTNIIKSNYTLQIKFYLHNKANGLKVRHVVFKQQTNTRKPAFFSYFHACGYTGGWRGENRKSFSRPHTEELNGRGGLTTTIKGGWGWLSE